MKCEIKLLLSQIIDIMKSLVFLFLLTLQTTLLLSQVGIGTTNPDSASLLDINSTDKGILIPRVDIIDLSTIDPVTGGATESLLVYNTNTTTGVGFYYWNGSRWLGITGNNSLDWSIRGNSQTDPSTNFLGTIDNTDFVIRTNNIERGRFIGDTGNFGIGTNTPDLSTGLTVDGFDNGIYSFTSSTNRFNTAIFGQNNGAGAGVISISSSATLSTADPIIPSMYSLNTAPDGATSLLVFNSSVASTFGNVALRVLGGSPFSINPNALNTGISSTALDLGLVSLVESPIDTNGDRDSAIFQTNYSGSILDGDPRDPLVRLAGFEANANTGSGPTGDTFYGAFLRSGSDDASAISFAYAGARIGGTNYKIVGNGTVSTIVEGVNNNTQHIMFTPEAPEVLFEDYGVGRLKNGVAQISIDPIFSKNIIVDEAHPLKVFIQLEGDCNGVYVTNKSSLGFTVKELQQGNSNTKFSWHIVANRKDDVSQSGSIKSKYGDLRFPPAPILKPAQDLKKMATPNIKK